MGELERAICETPPPKPELDADLDRILLQALEKDPARRYISAGALAEDLQRYLDGYPVLARKASWRYSTGKFIQRHRLSVVTASALVLLLIGVSIAMTVLAQRAKQQALVASQQARIANQTTGFPLGLFQANNPDNGRGDEITARELLDKGAAQLKRSGEQDPVVRVRLLDSMGEIYEELGASQQAKDMLEESVRLRETKLPKDDVALADTLSKLGLSEASLGNDEEACKLHERAVSIYRAKLPASDGRLAEGLYDLSDDLVRHGRLPEAESSLREAAALNSRNKGPKDVDTLRYLGQLAYVLSVEGKDGESYRTQRDVLEFEQATLPPNSWAICKSWGLLGNAAYQLGRLEEDEQDQRNALSVCLQTFEAAAPRVQSRRYQLGLILAERGKYEEAEPLLRQALAGYQKSYGPVHYKVANVEDALGYLFRAEGRTVEAREHGVTALQIYSKVDPDSVDVARVGSTIGETDYAAGNLEQASREIDNALDIFHRKFPDGRNFPHAHLESVAAEIRAAQGNLSAAEQLARNALDSAKAISPEGALNISALESTLGWVYTLEGKTGEGCPLLKSAVTIDEGVYGPRYPYTAQMGIRLAICDLKAGRREEADELVRKYVAPLLASHDGTYRVERRWLRTHPSPPASADPKLVSQATGTQPLP